MEDKNEVMIFSDIVQKYTKLYNEIYTNSEFEKIGCPIVRKLNQRSATIIAEKKIEGIQYILDRIRSFMYNFWDIIHPGKGFTWRKLQLKFIDSFMIMIIPVVYHYKLGNKIWDEWQDKIYHLNGVYSKEQRVMDMIIQGGRRSGKTSVALTACAAALIMVQGDGSEEFKVGVGSITEDLSKRDLRYIDLIITRFLSFIRNPQNKDDEKKKLFQKSSSKDWRITDINEEREAFFDTSLYNYIADICYKPTITELHLVNKHDNTIKQECKEFPGSNVRFFLYIYTNYTHIKYTFLYLKIKIFI
jgi:hypothetical protein